MNRIFYVVASFLIVFLVFLTVIQKQNRSKAILDLKLRQRIILEQRLNIDKEALKWLAVYMPPSIAVLVHSCGNPIVSNLIEQLIAYRSSKDELVVIVIQHCWHEETIQWLKSFGNEIYVIQGPEITLPHEYLETAYKHFWAFNVTFHNLRFENVVVLNDSLKISPGLQSYFGATVELLSNDPSLWCVSGYNDNGREDLIDTTEYHKLYRTDFFSGFAWMTSKTKWMEFGSKEWPKVYFQDWIRKQTVTRTLTCLRPEISRVRFTSDKFYKDLEIPHRTENHLDNIYLSKVIEDFPKLNLVNLEKQNYDHELISSVLGSDEINSLDHLNNNRSVSLRITYNNEEEFIRIAKKLNIMSDMENGVPRNSYKGIVTTMYRSHRIYLIPSFNRDIKNDLFGYK